MLDPAEVRSLLSYEKETGRFYWKLRGNPQFDAQYGGKQAGSIDGDGYTVISLHNRNYRAARLAHAIVHGEWPEGEIDHKDGNPGNDRWANLRVATKSQNAWNQRVRKSNKLGVKGVHYDAAKGGYRAQIMAGRKKKNLGTFPTVKQAAEAYRRAAQELHGEFARWRPVAESNRSLQRERLAS